MNFFIIAGLLFAGLAAYLIHRDIRRFRNAAAVFMAVICLLMGMLIDLTNLLPVAFGAILVLLIVLNVLLVMLFLVADSVVLIKKEGLHLVNLLPLSLAVFSIAFIYGTLMFFSYTKGLPHAVIVGGFMLIFIILFFYFLFGCFFVYSLIYGILPRNPKCDYIIIHGAGLNDTEVTPLLAARIDKAITLYHRCNDKALLIASGGQGADEVISEAKAMQNYLLKKGIAQDHIINEDRSTTTEENMLYSKAIMDQLSGTKNYMCYFVTNNYHAFRCGVFARRLGINGSAIGCHTALYYWPAAFLREYVAILKYYRRKILIAILILIALTILISL